MNTYKSIAVLLCAFLFSACSDWLDVEPDTSVDESKLFSTEQGFKDAVAGVYADMASSSLYGQTMTFGFMDILAQQYDYETINSMYSRFYRVADYDYEYSSNKSQIASIWRNMYNAVAEINNILRWADKNGGVMTEHTRHLIKGQCYLLRAYLHFDLLRMFAPDVKLSPNEKAIPYVVTFGVTPTERETVQGVIAKVKEDIETAKAELQGEDPIFDVVPYQIADKLLEADRYIAVANYFAADALLARVLLDEGKYSEAEAAAQRVIASGKFQLVDSEKSINVSADSLDLLFNDEQIFALRNQSIFDYSEDIHLGKTTETSSSGASLPLTTDIGGIYDGINDDIRLANWVQSSTDYMVKYCRKIAKFYPKQVLIKLSEMYLIVAEAQMRTGSGDALETLNTLRRSRILNASLADKGEISESVLIGEMRREFLGEGQMFFQYKRLNTNILNVLNEVPASNEVFVLPLPEGEIEYGKN